ncbi:hypothetical protein LUZ60_009581 [Juncus effusus]|nr:hypothetical protein LUZ60_009581 [Juncus effusus]
MALPKQITRSNSTTITTTIISLLITNVFISTFSLPQELFSLKIASKIRLDEKSISSVSSDFGNFTKLTPPAAVFHPSSPQDIQTLINFSFTTSNDFFISARGHGHSISGQASAPDGLIINMESIGQSRTDRINVSVAERYVDVGGEQLWVDVLRETQKYGLGARSWTDYLYLTVGGTLSVGGISGQTFRHGPQISNVLELDVITGKGELVTCSETDNSDLFHAVLGGLGQFGIITRARVTLQPIPICVKWVRLIYTDIARFTKDQEQLISMDENDALFEFLNYLEGSLLMEDGLIGSWRSSSFFSRQDVERISELIRQHQLAAVYCLEAVFSYDEGISATVDQELKLLFEKLSYVPGFIFTQEVSYIEFLDRVHDGELKLREAGQWEVPHPWLNLFVPKSRILDFDSGVFKGILRNSKAMGPVLIYPMNRNKWDDEMLAMVPDEEVFYTIGLLRSAVGDELKYLLDQNGKIIEFCNQEGIDFKLYMPNYTSKEGWIKHFGSKWGKFLELKKIYDPKTILTPGLKIFTT